MTPTIILASVTSLLFGCSDFLGGLASRRDSEIAVTANAHLLGLVLVTAAMLLWPAPFPAADLAWGAAAGVAGGIGVPAPYRAPAGGRGPGARRGRRLRGTRPVRRSRAGQDVRRGPDHRGALGFAARDL